MRAFSTDEIRDIFLGFFQKRDHRIIPGSPIRADWDPTLLYINSGMAPLKSYFLGEAAPPYPRLANIQACIRTRDIEDVGDRSHITFFEMLGSWSIGDYFKERAIELALELLVEDFGFPIEKLYATVFSGDPSSGLPPDTESTGIWERLGLPPAQIVPLGLDNFWGPAGETGPCGPCTEVFFDTGSAYGSTYVPGSEFDAERYIEIWNAGVFMMYDKKADGTYTPLPFKSVDTGAGLERLQLALNGYHSIYDTDVLHPLVEAAVNLFGDGLTQREHYILADHMRAATFILAEGVTPSNTSHGYVPRRLIRKCVALAVHCDRADYRLVELSDAVIDRMHVHYPHLAAQQTQIAKAILREVESFRPTIERGLNKIEDMITTTHTKSLSGEAVFDLVTTYGLPLEIITSHLKIRDLTFDEEAYWAAFQHHREISREGVTTGSEVRSLDRDLPATIFTGYEKLADEGVILALVRDKTLVDSVKVGESCLVIVDRTPFYAEAGGQVGDTGTGHTPTGLLDITDTTAEEDVLVHHATVRAGTVQVGQTVTLEVTQARRMQIARNHTATHLLHRALRDVLDADITQQGSRVSPEGLRFDFRYGDAIPEADLRLVEDRVNAWIRNDLRCRVDLMSYNEAVERDVTALFTDRYGDQVRVVSCGDVSSELCGGTHVGATGEIGLFLVTGERSVGRRIRRIEAVSGNVALDIAQAAITRVQQMSRILKSTPDQVVAALERVLDEHQKTEQPLSQSVPELARQVQTAASFEAAPNVRAFVGRLDVPEETLREIAEHLMIGNEFSIVTLAANWNDKVAVLVMVAPTIQQEVRADVLLKALLPLVEGNGGGNARIAMGGSRQVRHLDRLLKQSGDIIRERLETF